MGNGKKKRTTFAQIQQERNGGRDQRVNNILSTILVMSYMQLTHPGPSIHSMIALPAPHRFSPPALPSPSLLLVPRQCRSKKIRLRRILARPPPIRYKNQDFRRTWESKTFWHALCQLRGARAFQMVPVVVGCVLDHSPVRRLYRGFYPRLL